MLPSIDSYLYDEIEKKLKLILENRYIIEEILGGMNPKTVERFRMAYGGPDRRDIPIMFTMPQEKVSQRAAIYIGLREGRETKPSIGLHEGTYPFKQGAFTQECVKAVKEGDRLCFEVSKDIGELNNVANLEFAVSDNVTIIDNKIYFDYDDYIEGKRFYVNYIPTEGDVTGIVKGFTAQEAYSVLSVSTNMDTVRCLDLLIKAILILMRDNPEEQTGFMLQTLQFGQIEEIDTNRTSADGKPEMLFGREVITSYEVSYGLGVDLPESLNELSIVTNERNIRLDAKGD